MDRVARLLQQIAKARFENDQELERFLLEELGDAFPDDAASYASKGDAFAHIGRVEVQVLSVDKEKKKIALSIKRAERDPWTTVEQRYTPGQVVTGVITKIAPFGAFARIEDGVEGLIHLSELTPGTDPQTFHEGQQLRLRIIRIDAQRRRIGLSLRQADALDSQSIPGETLPEQSGR